MALFMAFSLVLINLISPSSVFALTNAAGTVAEVPLLSATGSNLDSDPGGFVLATRTGTDTIVQYAVGASPSFPVDEDTSIRTALYRSGTSMKVIVWTDAPVTALNTGSVYSVTLNNTANKYNAISLGSIYQGTSFNGGKYIEGTVTSYDNWVYALTPFESRSDALAAIQDYIPYDPFNPSVLEIPPGWVAYIKAPASTTLNLTLTCTMKEYSTMVPLRQPWYWVNQSYMFVNDYPTSSTRFPLVGSTEIPWMKDPSHPYTLTGQTKYAKYDLDLTAGAGRAPMLMIYNPLYYVPATQGGYFPNYGSSDTTNASIIVSNLRPGVDIATYPLEQVMNTDEGVLTVPSTADPTDPHYSTTTEEGGVTVPVDSSGNVMGYGGNTEAPRDTSIQSALDTIAQTLTDFVDRFVQLMAAPISHIQQLISAGSAFMQSLSGLYTWLPPEVSSTVISALIVIVVIGVFKVLL